jgi:Arc/MetJ-type ribon-helix-helix transcriptional regulator
MVRHKKPITVTLSEDLLEWINGEIDTARFGSVSHAVEFALRSLKNSEQKEKVEKFREITEGVPISKKSSK